MMLLFFSTLSHISSRKFKYIEGELNIYELPNYDMLDGIIVDTIPLTEDNIQYVKERIKNNLDKNCRIPVEILNLPLGDYDLVPNEEGSVFREITEHIIDVHKCRDIFFLTGYKNMNVSEERLSAFRKVMEEKGIPVKEDSIFYGDFWYSSGYDLAEKIISGEIHKPEAIICASDHMAIGVVNRLTEYGISVPKDIIVTGFEAVQEALLNDISITTFESNASKNAADAVDLLRQKIDPDKEIIPYDNDMTHIHMGMSCGCVSTLLHSYRSFKNSFYYLSHDFDCKDPYANVDIGLLMEGYVPETLMGTNTPEECLKEIYLNTYLMRPYSQFYLCLKEDWLEYDSDITIAYPDKMKLAVHTTTCEGSGFYKDKDSLIFDTKLMLPMLFDERENPCIFYFSPVHFQEKTLGYAVVQKSLDEESINIVYHNWLRFVNSSLEMIRAKNRLLNLSVYDEMTGAYNRRGMKMKLEELLKKAHQGDKVFVGVIDMDGLKYINDTYGHEEGDWGIKFICNAALNFTKPEEICIRAGGDEFYIIGIGDYTDVIIKKRVDDFISNIENKSKAYLKPYSLSASIGFAVCEYAPGICIEEIISNADVNMYRNKVARRKQRV